MVHSNLTTFILITISKPIRSTFPRFFWLRTPHPGVHYSVPPNLHLDTVLSTKNILHLAHKMEIVWCARRYVVCHDPRYILYFSSKIPDFFPLFWEHWCYKLAWPTGFKEKAQVCRGKFTECVP